MRRAGRPSVREPVAGTGIRPTAGALQRAEILYLTSEDELKEPERTCLGCRARKKQRDLRRLALDPASPKPKVAWDDDRRLGGRGAWLCRGRLDCLDLALKKRALLRAFRLAAEPDLTEIKSGPVADKKIEHGRS